MRIKKNQNNSKNITIMIEFSKGFLFLLLLCVLFMSLYRSEDVSHLMSDEEYQVYNENIDELQNLLFPNQTSSKPSFSLAQHWGQFRRKLGITKKPYTSSVPCTTCLALSNCPALNGYMVQEVYYPKNTALRETCTVLNELGGRMAATIFGEGRTFRDTSQCRCKNLWILPSFIVLFSMQ